jgi:hypothetical protein
MQHLFSVTRSSGFPYASTKLGSFHKGTPSSYGAHLGANVLLTNSDAGLFLFCLPLSQSHTGATTVLVNEFDSSFFERSPQYTESCLATIRVPSLKLTERCYSDVRGVCEFLLGPI